MPRRTLPGDLQTITPAQARFISWVSEVLVDIVVLNLFVEFVHTVVIDSFYISILTAVLLKLMVDAVKGLEQPVSAFYFAAKSGGAWKTVRVVAVLLILFVSKFFILEVVNVVFRDHVELGSFLEVAAIVVTMLAANFMLQGVYQTLADRDP